MDARSSRAVMIWTSNSTIVAGMGVVLPGNGISQGLGDLLDAGQVQGLAVGGDRGVRGRFGDRGGGGAHREPPNGVRSWS
ncbi:hypothetical protein [Cryobacterium sp. Hz9]|uniref:hypothetical protein n=1 Tax=Cryobacterium sp. Hz9 TaxID=1259167 RepID=UPI00106B34B4|nr:hypothetical protein [Cryobacterium sp. Hz9]TFB65022.1 hypothetical protein E3N85_12590 [Cryobacterium sp. Hz9]